MTRYKVSIAVDICKGCGICVECCPKSVLRLAGKSNNKGYNIVEVYRPEECIGCQSCEERCPDLAIWVVGRDKKVD